jgi:hypothetical protein
MRKSAAENAGIAHNARLELSGAQPRIAGLNEETLKGGKEIGRRSDLVRLPGRSAISDHWRASDSTGVERKADSSGQVFANRHFAVREREEDRRGNYGSRAPSRANG